MRTRLGKLIEKAAADIEQPAKPAPAATPNRMREIFAGQAFAGLNATAKALGISTKTLRNKLSLGTCPVRTVLMEGKRVAIVEDLIALYERKCAEATAAAA